MAKDTQPVELMGSLVDVVGSALRTKGSRRFQLDTIINAQSVAAGGNTGDIAVTITDETEIWVTVVINQQPWTLRSSSFFYPNAVAGDSSLFYPERNNAATIYSVTNPAVSLWLGGLTPSNLPTTLSDAQRYLVGYATASKIAVVNGSASVATITVKILRVWR